MKGLREKWAASFFTRGRTKSFLLAPYLLEESGTVALFVVKYLFTLGTPADFEQSPTYHVWDGDLWVLTTLSQSEAYSKYRELVRLHEERSDSVEVGQMP